MGVTVFFFFLHFKLCHNFKNGHALNAEIKALNIKDFLNTFTSDGFTIKSYMCRLSLVLFE